MNTITIFSPRTGSTILNEMLSFHRKNIDLDEFVSGSIRNGTLISYVKNIPVSVRNDLMQMLKTNNKFGLDKNNIDYVLALENSWSAKCIAGYDHLSCYFIETALKQNTELFYTKRRDIKAQCWSMIMAGVRSKQIKDKPNLAYVSLNVDSYPEIQPVYVDPIAAKTSIENIVSLSKEVNSLYDRFGGTMMVYEDTIDRGDFSLCGISNNSVESYKKLKIRLKRPEPRYPEQHAINWKEIDELIENNIQV
jgi:hypothetical protein